MSDKLTNTDKKGVKIMPSGASYTTPKKNALIHQKISHSATFAFAWILYVLLASGLFLFLEQKSENVLVDMESWKNFKEIWYSPRELRLEDVIPLQVELQFLCPHALFNYSLEDIIQARTEMQEARNSSGILLSSLSPTTNDMVLEVTNTCNETIMYRKTITHYSRFNYIDAIYYTMTLVTTIGFGNIAPTTPIGQIISILIAFFGVPLTCILMSKNSAMLSNKMLVMYTDLKNKSEKSAETVLYLVAGTFLFIGFIGFMAIPSFLFAYIEEWTYVESIYFTFITLSTIGFGDYIAGYNTKISYEGIYKIGIVIWIMVALGYWILLLSFLQKSIQHNTKMLRRQLRRKNLRKKARSFRKRIKKYSSFRAESHKDEAKQLHAMAFLVEKIYTNNFGMVGGLDRNPSRLDIDAHNPDTDTEDDYDSDDEHDTTTSNQLDLGFTLEDFMNTSVQVPTSSLPGIDKAIIQVVPGVQEERLPTNMDIPIRDIISLTLLVSSHDELDSTSSTYVDTTSEDSEGVNGQVVSSKEAMPLLKDVLESLAEKAGRRRPEDAEAEMDPNKDTIIDIP